MTAVCSGSGPSQPKGGYPDNVTLSVDAISAMLGVLGQGEASAALSLLISAKNYYLPTFCAADPPSDPGIDALDVAAALNYGDPQTSIPAIQKLSQWFQSQYWYQVCECASGTQPVPGTPSSPGGVGQNSGLPNGTNTPCFDNSYVVELANDISHVQQADITEKLLPVAGAGSAGTGTIGGLTGQLVVYYPIPDSVESIQTNGVAAGWDESIPTNMSHANCNFVVSSDGTTQLASTTIGTAAGNDPLAIPLPRGNAFIWPSAATHYSIMCAKGGVSGSHPPESISIHVVGVCGGAGLQGVCCPPDPAVMQKLEQIYGLLLNTYSIVPVAPKTYAVGASHSGLTGGGNQSLDVATTAIQVVIDDLPLVYTVLDGTPDTYIDVGWLTPMTAQGATAGLRVSRTTQVFVLPQATESVDYSFPTGESVTITELQPG